MAANKPRPADLRVEAQTGVQTGVNEDKPHLAPLKVSRVLHAKRETVFKAWSNADHVRRWFCPETFTVPDAKVEMRVG